MEVLIKALHNIALDLGYYLKMMFSHAISIFAVLLVCIVLSFVPVWALVGLAIVLAVVVIYVSFKDELEHLDED